MIKNIKMNKENLTISIFVIVIFAVLSWTVYSAFYGENYKKAISAENPDDICQVPQGYTQEKWIEHMGHHPDKYSQCLNK